MTYRTSSRFAPLLIYQIYPSSFYDSNGDGIGDLAGITAKLDHLVWLGVDAVWMCPICVSPGKDMGYDISEYRDIDPRYGTLEDFDVLVKEAKKRNILILMDLVANHSSSEHEWFRQDALSQLNPSEPNEYHDFYFWRLPRADPQTGEIRPPNNWKSIFQGSAWNRHPAADAATNYTLERGKKDSETQLPMYLRLYMPSQPDLNWENTRVRNAIWDVMKFWLDRGVNGFRMDVITLISKHPGLPDAPIRDPDEEWQYAPMYFANGPRIHEYFHEMHEKVLNKYNPRPLTIGEGSHTFNMRTMAQYVIPSLPASDETDSQHGELDLVINGELMLLDAQRAGGAPPRPMDTGDEDPENDGIDLSKVPISQLHRQFTLSEMKEVVSRWQTYKMNEGHWNCLFLENHDSPRSVSRLSFMSDPKTETPNQQGPKRTPMNGNQQRTLIAKLLALHQATLRGTLFIYQGQEIGMANLGPGVGIEEYKDGSAQRFWEAKRQERMRQNGGSEPDMTDIMEHLRKKARDHARTPMQWDYSPFAGFMGQVQQTESRPWMIVNEDYKSGWNVEAQKSDSGSVLRFWRECIRLRKEHIETLIYGDYRLLDPEATSPSIFSYIRSSTTECAVVALNFSSSPAEFPIATHLREALKQSTPASLCLTLGTQSDISEKHGRGGKNILLDTVSEVECVVKLGPYEGHVYMALLSM